MLTLLVALLVAQPETAPPPRPVAPPPLDPAALTGTWTLVSVEVDGKMVEPTFLTDELTLDAKTGSYRRRFGAPFAGGASDTGRFTVAKTATGFHADLTFSRYGGFGEGPARRTDETGRVTWEPVGRTRLRAADAEGVRVYERRER